jgi:hypothetical protein
MGQGRIGHIAGQCRQPIKRRIDRGKNGEGIPVAILVITTIIGIQDIE